MVKFGHVITAMVTPFDEDLRLDLGQAQALAGRLVDNGSDGLVISGTTGESPTLTVEEKISLFRAVVEAVGKRATIIAGTGNYSTEESIELTRAAEKTGVAGILLVSPYYNKPPQEGLFRHFKAVAEATGLPVMLYNIPGRTGVNIAADTLARLAEVQNIVAVKESSGNILQTGEYREKLPAEFQIFSGDDIMTLPMLSLGAQGVVSVAAHLVGAEIRKMIESAQSGQNERANAIQKKLAPFFRALFITTNPIMVKAALNLAGVKVGGLRLPLVEANEKERDIMRGCLKQLGLL